MGAPSGWTCPCCGQPITLGDGRLVHARAEPAYVETPASFFDDATPIPMLYTARLGDPVLAIELCIYPTYAFLEAAAPKRPTNVDRYRLADGNVGAGEPKQVDRTKVAEQLWSFADVDFTIVPAINRATLEHFDFENSAVSHIILGRFLPWTKQIRWRVYVSGPRDSGYAEIDVRGKIVDSHS